jgi:hypothetical protein
MLERFEVRTQQRIGGSTVAIMKSKLLQQQDSPIRSLLNPY